MRKFLLAFVAMLGAVTALPATSSAEGVVDVSIVVDDLIEVVNVPGTVVYKVTATNPALAPVVVDITDTITGGTINSSASRNLEGCSVTATTVSCTSVVLENGDRVMFVAVNTAPGTTQVKSTGTITYVPGALGGVDGDTSNNTSTDTTAAAPANESASYVPVNGTITYKKHSLTVREPGNGVITRLADVTFNNTPCGTGTCAPTGLHLDFYEGDRGEDYFGYVLTKVNLGSSEPCRGIGTTKCSRLFYRTDPGEAMTELQPCDGVYTDLANEGPCVERVVKVGNEFVWDVRMTSQDPDLGKLQL